MPLERLRAGRGLRTFAADAGGANGVFKRWRDFIGETFVYPPDADRPLTRADCIDGPRPCPWVSCSHHTYLDVNPLSGSLTINQPHLAVWEMPETCSLDAADRGGLTLEEVGQILGIVRERVRQIEDRCIQKIKAHGDAELGLPPERSDG